MQRNSQSGAEYIGTGVDLTELKRAEEALRRSEAYLVEAQKLTRTGSWAWDPRTDVFLHCSEELLRIFGFPRQERLPTVEEFLERVHPEDRERIRKRSVEGALAGTEHGAEYRLRLPDGEIKHIRSIRHPILNDVGEMIQVLGTAMDITDLKRREEALRRSEAYLAEAQKLTHTGSWARNMANGETTHSSDEHSRLFGFDPELGVPSFEAFSQRIHPEDRTRVVETFEKAIRERSDFAIDFRTLSPDGTLKHIHGVGHPVFDDAGDLLEYIGTAVDVTQSKRAEEQRMQLEERLRQAEKMEAVGRFATGIAHDFNNVLGGILGYGEMLHDQAPEGSKRKRYAQSVLTAATRGRELIDQILTYSRNQRGKHQPTELCRAVAETIELIAITLPSTVRLNARLCDQQLVVMGNATQLHQIVMNLCRNSMHAMGDGGMLDVAIKAVEVDSDWALLHGTLRAGRYGCVSVEDTGCGMDLETMSRIFEPFFTTKEVGRGTGLGLALVHAIVSDLGGAIDVKSTPGEGSRFSIYLPLIDLPAPVSSA